MQIEKTERGRTKNGLRCYLLQKKDFGEKMAAILIQRGGEPHILEGEGR